MCMYCIALRCFRSLKSGYYKPLFQNGSLAPSTEANVNKDTLERDVEKDANIAQKL